MKSWSINQIKKDLETRNAAELMEICLKLARFKKENKELMGFLLFDSENVEEYVESIQLEMDESFENINTSSVYFIKKSVRKIVRTINKYIRIAGSKTVEAELLIYFCNAMKRYQIPVDASKQLDNLYTAQLKKAEVALSTLHPDLQYDLRKQLQ